MNGNEQSPKLNNDTQNNNNNNIVENQAASSPPTTTKKAEQVLSGTWDQQKTYGAPFAKNGHTMVAYKDILYVYGGNNQQEDQTGQIHGYIPATQTWYSATEGPARTLHAAVVYKDSMMVFGGTGRLEVRSLFNLSGSKNYVPTLFNDVWAFQFATRQWSKYQTTGSIPASRDGHTCVVHDGLMYMFGGSDNTTAFCDLYSLSLAHQGNQGGVWMRTRSEGAIPSPRRMHTCVVWDDCLWVFGGYDGKTSFNDVYMYHIASGTWSIPRTSGAVPHKRFGHSAVVYKDFMYIFGGYGAGSGFRNDLLHFHFPTCTWTLLSDKSTVPPLRGHAAEVYQDSMYIFGGGTTSSTYSNDVWVYKFNDEKVEEIKNTFTEDLQGMLDNPAFYPDVVFKVGSKTIRAHKCILSARCSYFDSLFKSGFQEASTSEVVIDDIDQEGFVVLLQYLYGGPVHLITPDVSFELLTMAERYLLPHLKWVCESVILGGVTVENVVTLLIASETYKCTRLYRVCLDFLAKNHPLVVKTEEFKTMPHSLLLEVMAVVSAAK